MKKDLVIFDGSNFYHGAKQLSLRTHLIDFDYEKLVKLIAGGDNCSIEYCVGEIRQNKRDIKSQTLYANQQSLFYHLEQQGVVVKKGYMLRHLQYHEKGVDVQIAIDIVRGALKNEYSRCFLVSSDTDIIPAILDAQKAGKKIIYVGFDKSISRALKANCSETVLITKQMILECAKKRKK